MALKPPIITTPRQPSKPKVILTNGSDQFDKFPWRYIVVALIFSLVVVGIVKGQVNASAAAKAEAEAIARMTPEERAVYDAEKSMPTTDIDGIALPIKRHIMANAYDDDSVEFLACDELKLSTDINLEHPTWKQTVKIRAKNGFGAKIVAVSVYYIDHDRVVYSRDAY